MFQSMSLKAKLSVSVAAVSLLVLGTMTYLVAHEGFKTARENAYTISIQAARANASKVTAALDSGLSVARSYSQVLSGKKNAGLTSRDLVNSELHSLLLGNPLLIGAWSGWEPNAFDNQDAQWVGKTGHDQTGRFVPYWSYEKGQAYLSPLLAYDKPGDGDYYLVPKQRLKETVVEPYIYNVAGVPTLMTSAVVPIMIKGEFKGVGGVDLGLKDIQATVEKIKPFETSQAYLVSYAGNWVSHPKDEMITKKAEFAFESAKLLEWLKKGEELEVEGIDPVDGNAYLMTLVPVLIGKTEQPWGLVVKTPMATILASAKSLLWQQLVISGFGILVLLAAVLVLSHVISKSFSQLSGELNASTSEVSEAINQLTAAGHNLSQSASASAASLEETVASLEEMNSMVQRNSDSAKTAAELSRDSMSSVQKGEVEVKSLISQMEEISKSSKKIEEIIAVIEDIAFQTNLLALNAAVEAARAGEQGKGFAVVADAVRALAQRSSAAAKDITSLIQHSVDQVDSGSKRAQSSGEVLKLVVRSIEKVSALNEEIAKASEEQAIGVNQISVAMNQLDQSVQTNAASAEEIAASAQQIDSQSGVMKTVAVRIHENVKGAA